MLRFACRACGAAVVAPTRASGKTAPCPRCLTLLSVPEQANGEVGRKAAARRSPRGLLGCAGPCDDLGGDGGVRTVTTVLLPSATRSVALPAMADDLAAHPWWTPSMTGDRVNAVVARLVEAAAASGSPILAMATLLFFCSLTAKRERSPRRMILLDGDSLGNPLRRQGQRRERPRLFPHWFFPSRQAVSRAAADPLRDTIDRAVVSDRKRIRTGFGDDWFGQIGEAADALSKRDKDRSRATPRRATTQHHSRRSA